MWTFECLLVILVFTIDVRFLPYGLQWGYSGAILIRAYSAIGIYGG